MNVAVDHAGMEGEDLPNIKGAYRSMISVNRIESASVMAKAAITSRTVPLGPYDSALV
jgi:hypothetical protein